VYDCFGAGQRISQVTFAGRHRHDGPDAAQALFTAFGVLRTLHELLTYLGEALARTPEGSLRAALVAAADETRRLASGDAETLTDLDAEPHRRRVADLLRTASEAGRTDGGRGPGADAGRRGRRHRGAVLVGARLRGADLRRADLAGSCLLGADLRRADLRDADLIGADLRAADLRGADLRDAWFVTPSQLLAARGDAATRLPADLPRPPHWATTS